MPIYEYECTKCGHHTESWQKFSDAPLTECNLCHGKMKKLISHSSFHLKGNGWYVTDYASRSGEGHGKSGTSNNQTTSSQSTDSSETSNKTDASSKGSEDSSKKKDLLVTEGQ